MSDHEIQHELRHIRKLLELILSLLPRRAKSATLTLNGETMLTVHLNDAPGSASFQEFDGLNGSGNRVPAIGPVSFASSDPTIAAVDPNTGSLSYVAAGTATISGTDAGNSLTASDVLTVIASLAVSAVLTLTPGAVPISAATKKA